MTSPVTSAAAVVAASDDERAEPERAGADGRGRGDGGARAVGDRLGFPPAIVRVDDALRFASDRVEQARRDRRGSCRSSVAAEDPIAVLAPALREPRRRRACHCR